MAVWKRWSRSNRRTPTSLGDDELAEYLGDDVFAHATAADAARWLEAANDQRAGGVASGAAEDLGADVLRMVTKWAGLGVNHWLDLELAEAWFQRAVDLTSDSREAALDALSYPEQARAVEAALDALANGYRALNLPMTVDPVLRGIVTRDIDGASANPYETKAWGAWANAHGAYTRDGSDPNLVAGVSVWERYRFRADSTVEKNNSFAMENNADLTPSTTLWENHYNLRGSGDQWWWKSYAFKHECRMRQADDCHDWDSTLLPPRFWYFRWVREIARSCVARGPLQIVVSSVRCAFLLNVKQAAGYSHRDPATGRVRPLLDVVAEGNAAFAGLAGVAQLDFAAASQWDLGPLDTVFGVLHTLSGLDPSGIASWVVDALKGLVHFIANILPRAVGHIQDVFGYDLPVFNRDYLTGGETDDAPPTHTVAEPSGWVRGQRMPRLPRLPGQREAQGWVLGGGIGGGAAPAGAQQADKGAARHEIDLAKARAHLGAIELRPNVGGGDDAAPPAVVDGSDEQVVALHHELAKAIEAKRSEGTTDPAPRSMLGWALTAGAVALTAGAVVLSKKGGA